MLVLSRKTEQRIRIGDEIEIIVLAIEGDHVKIGIQAPRHITVLRYELV
ncbi:MAG: carbon storage regulator, partial [Proteobacteria bacterium]|nr:carbon storage regulator [Pseudomonadota bacterium]